MATYMYDNLDLHKVLVRRLQQQSFQCTVRVDAEAFTGRTPFHQRARLAELHQNGGKVFLCRGAMRKGPYHRKALVADRRYLYTGGANLTSKSRENKELCWRMTGPVVGEFLKILKQDAEQGILQSLCTASD